MKVLAFFLLLLLCQFQSFLTHSQSSIPSKPNIIFIMVDDMGYADLSYFGRKDYQTPVIDNLIRGGINFSQAYAAAPVCTPTRVALMTGRFPARTEVGLREPLAMSQDDIGIGLPDSLPSVSFLLQKNGYQTALIGKWHLGVGQQYLPTKRGFDYFFGITSGAVDYIDHRPVHPAPDKYVKTKINNLYENENLVERKGYLTNLLTEQAVAYIKGKHNKPFFLNLQYNAPHWPWQAPTDESPSDSLPLQAKTGTYGAMVKNLDENIGKVLQALQEAGLSNSTLIIFTSDNGGEDYSDMGPFKGRKMTLWEGGLRVPAAVYWPGVVKAGSESKQPVITMDWSVTILALAGITAPNNWDGINLIPYLKGNTPSIPRTFYWRTANRVQAHALRQGDWKYMQTAEGEFLFNLAEDPYEKLNLKDKFSQKLASLKGDFIKLDQQMLPPLVLGAPIKSTKK